MPLPSKWSNGFNGQAPAQSHVFVSNRLFGAGVILPDHLVITLTLRDKHRLVVAEKHHLIFYMFTRLGCFNPTEAIGVT